jgi:hypothetical protein
VKKIGITSDYRVAGPWEKEFSETVGRSGLVVNPGGLD